MKSLSGKIIFYQIRCRYNRLTTFLYLSSHHYRIVIRTGRIIKDRRVPAGFTRIIPDIAVTVRESQGHQHFGIEARSILCDGNGFEADDRNQGIVDRILAAGKEEKKKGDGKEEKYVC